MNENVTHFISEMLILRFEGGGELTLQKHREIPL